LHFVDNQGTPTSDSIQRTASTSRLILHKNIVIKNNQGQIIEHNPNRAKEERAITTAMKKTSELFQSRKLKRRSSSDIDDPTPILHGTLLIDIIEAKNLPNLDSFLLRSSKDVSDPYVTVDTVYKGEHTSRLIKTRVMDNNLNPKWEESFQVQICHKFEALTFTVKDMDVFTSKKMGFLTIRAQELLSSESIEGWFPLTSRMGRHAGSIRIFLKFKNMEGAASTQEVPGTYFAPRTLCSAKLYQDAHTPALPPVASVQKQNGQPYRPPELWADIRDALLQARKLIYVVGQSVNADISLLRSPERDRLGEILKRKAEEGVRVLVMVNSDERTKFYFQGSSVQVLLATRTKRKTRMLEQKLVITTPHTHHQKYIIVDKESNDNRRRLAAFVGGLDITDGRWDTPQHSLYQTLNKEHKNDFYNNVCQTSVEFGPREPWHDVHMYTEGKIVNDLMTNFIQRWRYQAPHREQALLHMDPTLFDLDWEESGEKSTYNIQFFRSINSDSVNFPFNIASVLKVRKGRLYEDSIQQAYIHHINRAKRFIYIENQHFIGSSHSWKIPHLKCTNLIPMEITARIIRAVYANEPFRVYILIPLHPDGDPTSSSVQEILCWQYRTVSMMYRTIAKTIKKTGRNEYPTDYLTFFCLAKREESVPSALDPPPYPKQSVVAKLRQSLRFMIYIHSKLAIFDDEYILIGSANINERSMNGNRDTEVALGAYQPHFTVEKANNEEVQGDIHAFRLALWAEHCNMHMEQHLKPSSIDCMRVMRELGRINLKKYSMHGPFQNNSHLMLYPYLVDSDGRVELSEQFKQFPDTGGSIVGKDSFLLPNSVTM